MHLLSHVLVYRLCLVLAGVIWETLHDQWAAVVRRPNGDRPENGAPELACHNVHLAALYGALVQRLLQMQLHCEGLQPGDVPELQAIAASLHLGKLRQAWEVYHGKRYTMNTPVCNWHSFL